MIIRDLVRLVSLAILAFFLPLAVGGQTAEKPHSTKKPPWEWTLEERIAARYDLERVKVLMAERNQLLRTRGQVEQAERELVAADNNQLITGRDNPELFLPTELFNVFLANVFHHDRELRLASRKRYVKRSSLELDEEFWRDISVIASNLLTKRHRYRTLRAEVEAAPPEEKDRLEGAAAVEQKELFKGFCGELKDALDQVRALYGDAFDRFLYETVPAGLTINELVQPDTASAVRRRERGCRDGS